MQGTIISFSNRKNIKQTYEFECKNDFEKHIPKDNQIYFGHYCSVYKYVTIDQYNTIN